MFIVEACLDIVPSSWESCYEILSFGRSAIDSVETDEDADLTIAVERIHEALVRFGTWKLLSERLNEKKQITFAGGEIKMLNCAKRKTNSTRGGMARVFELQSSGKDARAACSGKM